MADPAEAPQFHSNCHVTLDIPDIADKLLFHEFTPPAITLATQEFKSWSQNGLPVNSVNGGKHYQPATVSFGRGVDPSHKIYTWINDCKDKGVTADTKKEVTATVMGEDGSSTIETWTFHGAVISQWQRSPLSAQSGAVLTETMTLMFDDFTFTPGG
jgi:phage tail-like protein